MVKLKYPVCCGVDVHKKSFVATIALTDRYENSQYLVRTFSTMNPDLLKFHDWLIQHQCRDVCMESTGKYWIPIFNYLEDDIRVCLTHPKYVRAIKGKKTDKKDSKWIVDLFKLDLVRSSFIPPKDFRQLRELTRFRYKLVGERSAEKNRIQNCMTISNIGLGSILSDPLGRSSMEVLSYLIAQKDSTLNEEEIKKRLYRTAKNKSIEIIEAVQGYNIQPDTSMKLVLGKDHIDQLNEMIQKIDVELLVRIEPYYDYVELLTTIPGISKQSAIMVLSEIGVNMDVFDSDKQLTSWCGLTPANNESAGKKKSVRISKAGTYLKPMMVQCALAAVKSKKEPYFAQKYFAIKKRRGHKKAIIAIARMMMTSIYHMVKNHQAFQPSDYEDFMRPQANQRLVVMTEEAAMKFLQSSGYDISSLVKSNEV